MDAMKWDDDTMKVIDPLPGEMNPVSPPQMHISSFHIILISHSHFQ